MISFKNFLNEAQWMYHGSPKPNLKTIERNNFNRRVLDVSIGAHFAADPEISWNFAKSGGGSKGAVYKTKRPTRSELEVVPQKKGNYDDDSVAYHVLSTVFSQPDNKDLFVKWHRNIFDSTQERASYIHDRLSNKQNIPVDKKEYGHDISPNTFRSYVEHNGVTSGGRNPDIHHEIVNKFIDHMKSKGKKGLVYRNTSPIETEGARSKKNYIIFEPEKLKVEKHDKF